MSLLLDETSGYAGLPLELLQKAGASVGDRVRIRNRKLASEGLLMPRPILSDQNHVVIKLDSGYNVGMRLDRESEIAVVGRGAKPQFSRPPEPPKREGLPRVVVISTGGTIASKVDYRTGAVEPALTAEDLYSVIPELAEVADVETDILYQILSENMTPKHWMGIAERVAQHVRGKADGIVVAQGTDTLGYSAAALSFALQDLPIPAVFVGAQRSSDRPSSDAASNLLAAVYVAGHAQFSGVYVAMHHWTSDDTIAIHRGTKVRKCHTSRRDAFKSVNCEPVAIFDQFKREIRMGDQQPAERSTDRKLQLRPEFDERAALVKFYPGMEPTVIDYLSEKGYKGIILEGTGLGHVSRNCFDSISNFLSKGSVVMMTSQCIWGRVGMNVYGPGRDLQRLGVVPLEDMLPETAIVKLMWCLAQKSDPPEIERLMQTNVAGEISPRTLPIREFDHLD